jgi:uncharacterized phage-like protein YoqJ
MPIIGISGHRPKYWGNAEGANQALVVILKEVFLREKPDKIITGMALGMDTAAAEAAIELGIPFVAAVPFLGQETVWPKPAQEKYRQLLEKAQATIVVSPGGYSDEAFLKRNEYIVANCHRMVVLFDGNKRSGTGHAMKLAAERQIPLENVWEQFKAQIGK